MIDDKQCHVFNKAASEHRGSKGFFTSTLEEIRAGLTAHELNTTDEQRISELEAKGYVVSNVTDKA